MNGKAAIKGLSPENAAALEAECAALRPECMKWLQHRFDIPEDQSEDVFQSACLRAVLAIRRGLFLGGSSVKTWFFRIAEREALDRLRSAARREEPLDALLSGEFRAVRSRSRDDEGGGNMEPRLGPDAYRQIQPIPPPYARIVEEERAADLRAVTARLLGVLSDKARPVVERFYLRGEEYSRIAEALSVKGATVNTRLHGARNALRRRFADRKRPNSTSAMIRSILSTAALAALLAAPATFAETYLRIHNGAEQYATVETNRLPAEVVAPLVERMEASGYAPFVAARRPADTWCTTWARTLELRDGAWHEGWEEASVPVPVDRQRVVAVLLALPDGEAKLAAALSSEAVASWFAENPVYTRGSYGARAVAAALGVTEEQLEELVHAARIE